MNNNILTRQRLLLLILLCACLGVAGFFSFYVMEEDKPVVRSKKVDLPGDKINPQNLWMSRFENESKILDQRIRYLEELILETRKNEQAKSSENVDLRKEIANLKSQLKSAYESPKTTETVIAYAEPAAPPQLPSVSYMDPFSDAYEIRESEEFPPLSVVVANRSKRKVKHVNTSIPSGTTVKAVLVSSVDAPCGILSQADPRPVKLRILDDGHLPKGVDVLMRGGIIIASVHGDLSSERAIMRLERLTQVKKNGEFCETEIAGFVTGEDGKFGVRGVVVDKSLNMVGNAALSGFFSEVGDYLQAKASRGWNNSYRNETVDAANSDILVQGGIRGGGSAFDKLTDYYIRRAEQIRPVIQVTAGRIVDITFTHETEIGDLHVKNKINDVRTRNRNKNVRINVENEL